MPQKAPQSLNCGAVHDGALSGIAAHLQGRRHTLTGYGTLARKDADRTFKKDGALARKTVHF